MTYSFHDMAHMPLSEKVTAIARMSEQEIRTLELDPDAHSYDVRNTNSRMMRFNDIIILVLE